MRFPVEQGVSIPFEALLAGDFVQVRVGNERLWFEVIALVDDDDQPANAVIVRAANRSACGAVYDGCATFDRSWIMDARAQSRMV